jgi:hypothetical protein
MASIYIFVLVRFGLLSLTWSVVAVSFFKNIPATLDASAWYFGYGLAALAIFAAIVLYAFRSSLGSRPLITSSRLDE